ncbi:MAG: aminotransferase class V-fold PLP-dependent enzyme [Acidimicrobiales bacterium]
MIDVEAARADTPGCALVAHLNNAGAALPPTPVVEAVVAHLRREAAIGGYEAAAEAADALERPYPAAAALLGCRPDEVAVVESATRAWQAAFLSVPLAPGDRVLTSAAEYGSNVVQLLHSARGRGVSVDVVPDDAFGQVDVDALAAAVDERVKLVALTHVPTGNGLVNPAAEVGRVARVAGVTFLLDACQSLGQLPVDVGAIGCDLAVGTSRKFLRGPRGVGLLYARASTVDRLRPALVDLRSASWDAADRYHLRDDARRFEAWEISAAAKVGFGVALDYARARGVDAIWARVAALAADLRAALGDVPGVQVHDRGAVRGAIVTFSVAGHEPAAVRDALHRSGINVWVTDAGQARFDLDRRGISALVRASVHYYNTAHEVDRCVAAVAALPRP